MSLIFFLKPHFFGDAPPVVEVEGGHFIPSYDPKAFKKYQEELKKRYSYRKHEPKERIVVLPEEGEVVQAVEAPEKVEVTFEAINLVANELANQAGSLIATGQAMITLERLLDQYRIAKQKAAAIEAEQIALKQAAIEQALAEKWALEEMTRYAHMLRLRKKRRDDEEALVLMLLRQH